MRVVEKARSEEFLGWFNKTYDGTPSARKTYLKTIKKIGEVFQLIELEK